MNFTRKQKEYLKAEAEKNTYNSTTERIKRLQIKALQRKKWKYHDRKLQTTDRKIAEPKSQPYDTLVLSCTRTAHRGCQITSKWINENYSKVTVRVVNLFVSLSPLHEQQTITSHVQLVTKPLELPSFLSLIKIDLMGIQNCLCSCSKPHYWAMNIINHHTKFITMTLPHDKTAEEVLSNFTSYCYRYGFPMKIISNNGRVQKKTQTILSIKWDHNVTQCTKNTKNSRIDQKE